MNTKLPDKLPDNLFTELLPASFKRQQEYCKKMDKARKKRRKEFIKNNLRKFDETKEYGCSVLLHNQTQIDFAKEVLRDNMKLSVPEKFQGFVSYHVEYQKAVTIKVKEDNLEQLGATSDEIGKRIDMPEHWLVSWHYRRAG